VFSSNTYYDPPYPTNWETHPGGHGVVIAAFAAEFALAALFARMALGATRPSVSHLSVIAAVASPLLILVSVFAVGGN
jgi:hypothetical protein